MKILPEEKENASQPPLSGQPAKYFMPGFVITTASKRIDEMVLSALAEKSICLVWGPSGTGKTRNTLNLIDRLLYQPFNLRHKESMFGEKQRFVYYKATGEETTPLKLARNLLETLGMVGLVNRTESMDGHLLRALLQSGVEALIIDEAQELPFTCYNWLWKINEAAGLAIIYLANEDTFLKLQGPSHTLERIRNRISTWIEVSRPTRNDISLIIQSCGIQGQDELDYAERITKRYSLHGLFTLLKRAVNAANSLGLPLDTSLLFQTACAYGQDSAQDSYYQQGESHDQ